MNVWVHPKTGLRNREYRPYIEEEEQSNSVYLYDPLGPGFHYGLYETAQPSCGSWADLFHQYPSHVPSEVIDSTGRMHMVRPNYWRHGYKYPVKEGYENLVGHTRPTGMTCSQRKFQN